MPRYILYCDGFIKNGGGCSVAVTKENDEIVFKKTYYIEKLQNENIKNLLAKYRLTVPVAEYFALFMALSVIRKLELKKVIVYSDAELIVNQINNRWEVSNYVLKKWYNVCKQIKGSDTILLWISRKRNVEILGH